MKKIFIKITAVTLIIGLNWFGISAMFNITDKSSRSALAYFNDIEPGKESKFNTAVLNFSLHSDNDFLPAVTFTSTAKRNIKVNNDGNADIEYVAFIPGVDDELCQDLKLKVLRNDVLVYNDSLLGFNLYNVQLASSSYDSFDFTVSSDSDDSELLGKICLFDFVFSGAQASGAGFTDTEKISNTVYGGAIQNVRVIDPNGEEIWWVRHDETIKWLAHNPDGDDGKLLIDLYYSGDKEHLTWGHIGSTTNSGSYTFCVPLNLPDGYFMPSPTAKVKIIVWDEHGNKIGEDMSDEDFCPPIDCELLLPEEIEALKEMGLYEEFCGADDLEENISNQLNALSENTAVDNSKSISTGFNTVDIDDSSGSSANDNSEYGAGADADISVGEDLDAIDGASVVEEELISEDEQGNAVVDIAEQDDSDFQEEDDAITTDEFLSDAGDSHESQEQESNGEQDNNTVETQDFASNNEFAVDTQDFVSPNNESAVGTEIQDANTETDGADIETQDFASLPPLEQPEEDVEKDSDDAKLPEGETEDGADTTDTDDADDVKEESVMELEEAPDGDNSTSPESTS